MSAAHRQRLRDLLADPHAASTPGAFDALSAVLSERYGFEAIFLSGSAVAYSQLGRPDVGLITLTEMAQVMERVRDRVELPVLVDADQGYGNALTVQRAVRMLERAGASGIQIEDQQATKPLALATQRPLVSCEEMCGKIRAALDSRNDDQTVISARSDARFSGPLNEALDRASAYADAGADMVFVEGLKDLKERHALADRIGLRASRLHHVLPEQLQDNAHRDELVSLSYAIALYPASLIGSVFRGLASALADLPRSVPGAADLPANLADAVGTAKLQSTIDQY